MVWEEDAIWVHGILSVQQKQIPSSATTSFIIIRVLPPWFFLPPHASSRQLYRYLWNTCKLAANSKEKKKLKALEETKMGKFCWKSNQRRGICDLNNPDTEQWFNAEKSKTNEVEYLQVKMKHTMSSLLRDCTEVKPETTIAGKVS